MYRKKDVVWFSSLTKDILQGERKKLNFFALLSFTIRKNETFVVSRSDFRKI